MECQIVHWIVAGPGPTTLQHALVGVGCLLAYDSLNRWRKKRTEQVVSELDASHDGKYFNDQSEQRRAA